jgi:hypothetical protein
MIKYSEDLFKFQLEEYKNISQAHFETNKQIGIFYRYLLIIASAPGTILIWFGNKEGFLSGLLSDGDTIKNVFIGSFLIIIALVGMFACFYLISLRLDSILYARTVNGLRKFFYLNNIAYEDHFRVLPKQTNQPKYRDWHTFGILVYSTAIINSVYFALGLRIIASVGDDLFSNYFKIGILIKNFNIWWVLIFFLIMLFIHYCYYTTITKYRQITYMKSQIIGVDIDGVLNKHRDAFCEMHEKNMIKKYGEIEKIPDEKKLTPEEINIIPVNRIKNKKITVDDEFDVFNNPEYWEKQLEISPGVGKIIKKLKNSYGYRINIHSYRPWPQYAHGTLTEDEINSLWKGKSLTKITKQWLKESNIPSSKVHIEKSSIDISKKSMSMWGILFGFTKSQFKNRFYYTGMKPYRYFVEDTFENAIKLSSNCDYVFLIEQTYNGCEQFQQELPPNIIRVNKWEEIEDKIKELG